MPNLPGWTAPPGTGHRAWLDPALSDARTTLAAMLESSSDSVLLVNRNFRVEGFNQRFVDFWHIPEEILSSRDDLRIMAHIRHDLRNAGDLEETVRRLECEPAAERLTIYEFLDGRTVESYIRPRMQDGEVAGWIATHRDITAARAAEALRRSMLARLISVQEDERRRVSRELHDDAGQSLTALLVTLKRALEGAQDEKQKECIVHAREIAARLVEDLGRLARGLRPSTLDDLGLVPAIEGIVRDYARLGQVHITLAAPGLERRRFAPEVEVTIYRIIQEALHNAFKHADARRISVKLVPKGRYLWAFVADNGRGFQPSSESSVARRALGVQGMFERAGLVGGRVRIRSRPGRGTTVLVQVPAGNPET